MREGLMASGWMSKFVFNLVDFDKIEWRETFMENDGLFVFMGLFC